MPLDTQSTDPMYILGRVVALRERHHDLTDHHIDTILARPNEGLALALQGPASDEDEEIEDILAMLPADGMPDGPMSIEAQMPYWTGYYHQRGANRRARHLQPHEMERIGQTLYGRQWQTEMTTALDLRDSSRVRAWLRGDRPIPGGVLHDLLALLRIKSDATRALATEIDRDSQ